MTQDMVEVLKSHGLVKGVGSTSNVSLERLTLCVNSSLDHLPADDRVALAILTIFPNKFDAATAAAVLDVDKADALACLARLQLKSWVSVTDDVSLVSPQCQYELHLLIRDMAAAGYETHPKCLAAQQAFLQHFLNMLHDIAPKWTPEGVKSVQQLKSQGANLKKALSQLAKQQVPVAELQKHCHLGLFALDALVSPRLDTEAVAKALRKLLFWAEAEGDPQATANAQEQLGAVLAFMPEHLTEAEKLLTMALKAQQDAHGEEHLSCFLALHGLALLMERKAYEDSDEDNAEERAAAYYQQLHKVLCKNKGEADPQTLACVKDVARYLPHSADRLQMLQHNVVIAEDELGGQHPVAVLLKFELARLTARSDFEDVRASIPELRDNLKLCSDQRGQQDGLTIQALMCLGKALVHSNEEAEQQEGLQLLRQAIATVIAEYGRMDEIVLGMQADDLVPSLILLDQHDDAIQLLAQLQPAYEQVFGEKSLDMLGLLRQYAEAYEGKNDYPAAEQYHKKAIATAKASKQALSVREQTSFAVRGGLYLNLAGNLEEQGK